MKKLIEALLHAAGAMFIVAWIMFLIENWH